MSNKAQTMSDKALAQPTSDKASTPTNTYIHTYRVIERLGKGCFSTVFKATHRTNGRIVAIKVEPRHTTIKHESQILAYLGRELSIDMRWCVPTVHWYGTFGGNICLAMTFYSRPLTTTDDMLSTLDLCCQIVKAFCHIHTAGVIHCDVKPDNFMLDDRGRVVVIDFGFASLYRDFETGEHRPNIPSTHLIGSPKYASYFVHQGNRISRRDDLISVGYLMMWLFGIEMEWINAVMGSSNLPVYDIHHPANVERAKYKKPEKLISYLSNPYLISYFECVYNLEYDDDPDYSEYLRGFSTLY